ncbi:hypothetical protein ACLKA7_001333 [Drosophila subpalustris]
MENDDYQPLLRRRRNSNLKGTESQVLEFLELVLDLVKDVPESLEKPTAQKFYAKVMERSYTFKDLNYVVLKNKMRLFRSQYISAVQWRSNTGAGFLAEGKCESVKEYMEKVCPNFTILEQIYGQRKNIEPKAVTDSTDCDVLEGYEYLFDERLRHDDTQDSENFDGELDSFNKIPISPTSRFVRASSEPSISKPCKTPRKESLMEIVNNMQQGRDKLDMNMVDIEKEKLAWEKEKYKDKPEKFQKKIEAKRGIRAMELDHEKEMKKMETEKERLLGQFYLSAIDVTYALRQLMTTLISKNSSLSAIWPPDV